MKSTYFAAAAAVLVAGSAFAGVQTANQVGRIAVTGVTTNTIIALPFVDIDYPAVTTVTATNYVLTIGLKEGDRLTEKVLNNDGKYEWKGWMLTADGGSWQPVATEDSKWKVPATAEFARGKALMLTRTDPQTSNPFYLLGQVVTDDCTVTPVAGTTTFVGNPLPRDTSLVELIGFVAGQSTGDQIRVTMSDGETVKTINYRSLNESNVWCYSVRGNGGVWTHTEVTASNDVTIPAGTGFEYISKGSTAPTLTFRN